MIECVGCRSAHLEPDALLDADRLEQRKRNRLRPWPDQRADRGAPRPPNVVLRDRKRGLVDPLGDALVVRIQGNTGNDVSPTGAFEIREIRAHRIRSGRDYRQKWTSLVHHDARDLPVDRKSTRLNSSHVSISY